MLDRPAAAVTDSNTAYRGLDGRLLQQRLMRALAEFTVGRSLQRDLPERRCQLVRFLDREYT